MEIALGIVIAVALGLVGLSGHLIHRLRRSAEQRMIIERQIEEQSEQLNQDQQELAAIRERHNAAIEKFNEYKQQTETLGGVFESLANKTLDGATKRLLEMANEKFTATQKLANEQLDNRKQNIEQMTKQVRESLENYQKQLGEAEKQRTESLGSLRQVMTRLQEDQLALRDSTQRLVTALRRPDVRGRWGEMQLQRVAELAGMINHCDFDQQVSVQSDDGRLRPDMIVRLPGGRSIVVDAKTPLEGYINALEAEEDQRPQHLQQHVRHIQQHVKQLSSKSYQDQFQRSPDFVVLFIPGDSFVQAAVNLEPQLIEDALGQNVVIASPTTLITLLKAVAMGWQEQRLTENAEQVRIAGLELYKRLNTVLGYVHNMGKSLAKTNDHFNQMVRSMESRLIVQARKFGELGVVDEEQSIEDLPRIEINPQHGTLPNPESADNSDESTDTS